MLKIDPDDEEDEEMGDEVLNPDGTVNRAATRAKEARDTVILLPGTHDGWQVSLSLSLWYCPLQRSVTRYWCCSAI